MNLAQLAPPRSSNPRKQQLREEIEASLDEIERWRKINAAYHADDLKFMRFLIPPGKRVLELGCGMGDLLPAVMPCSPWSRLPARMISMRPTWQPQDNL